MFKSHHSACPRFLGPKAGLRPAKGCISTGDVAKRRPREALLPSQATGGSEAERSSGRRMPMKLEFPADPSTPAAPARADTEPRGRSSRGAEEWVDVSDASDGGATAADAPGKSDGSPWSNVDQALEKLQAKAGAASASRSSRHRDDNPLAAAAPQQQQPPLTQQRERERQASSNYRTRPPSGISESRQDEQSRRPGSFSPGKDAPEPRSSPSAAADATSQQERVRESSAALPDIDAALERFRAAAAKGRQGTGASRAEAMGKRTAVEEQPGQSRRQERRPRRREPPKEPGRGAESDADLDWGRNLGGGETQRMFEDLADRSLRWIDGAVLDAANGSAEGGRRGGEGRRGYSGDEAGQRGIEEGKGSRQPDPSSVASGPVPEVDWLTAEEVGRLIPVAPMADQYAYYQGQNLVQSVGVSSIVALFALAFTQATVVAVGAAAFPFLAPMGLAAARNLPVRNFSFCGLWSSKVLEVQWSELRRADSRKAAPASRGARARNQVSVVSILLGDNSGARTRVEIETDAPKAAVQVGDRIQAVVVSNDSTRRAFQVVRELFLVEENYWIAEYPFINRNTFRQINTILRRNNQGRQG